MAFEQLVSQYGYPAVLLGTILEGEIVLFAGGFVAHSGYLKLEWVMLAAFVGSLVGDQLYFLLGRLKGKAFLQRRPHWQQKVEKVSKLLDRHQALFVIGLRFMSGLRTVTPFALGLTAIGPIRFLLLNAIGAVAWSVLGSLVGYMLGVAAQAVGINVNKYEHLIILGMFCAGALVFVVAFLYRKWSSR